MYKIEKTILWSFNEGSHLDNIFFFLKPDALNTSWPLGEVLASSSNQPWAEPGIHTKPARGLRCSWGQVGNVTSFFFFFRPDSSSWTRHKPPLFILGQFVFPSLHRDHTALDCKSKGAAWDLTDSWQQSLFLSPIWPDMLLKAKGLGSPVTHFNKVKCIAKQLFHCCKTLSYLLIEKHEQCFYPLWFEHTAVFSILDTYKLQLKRLILSLSL